jgi:hypothetical protein
LAVTLFIAVMMGLFLGAYLSLARQQNALVARSQGWNAAMGMAEAGVEEAMGQLNPGAPAPPTVNRAANGWGGPSGGVYGPVSRTVATGSSYSVLLTADTFPIIYATGYVTVPSLSATLSRAVRATTTNASLFTVGLVGIYGINFGGSGTGTDSYNSANANLSTAGQYDPTKASTNGGVASVTGILDAANATIKGNVYLGPTATNTINNGTVSGGVSHDFNVQFENVVLPAGTSGWVSPMPDGVTTISNVTYQYVFGYPGSANNNNAGDYAIAGSLLNSANIYVGANTHVRLYVTGNASPTYVHVIGAGTNSGQLTLYMDGPSFTMSGNNSVDSGNAANFSYYGTTNNTQVTLSGNTSFIGTIYAPQADIKLSGSGTSPIDFGGAIVARTATIGGHYLFHFDENLLGGPSRGYVVTSWQEI